MCISFVNSFSPHTDPMTKMPLSSCTDKETETGRGYVSPGSLALNSSVYLKKLGI